jgi:hypothetical protein
MNDAYLTQARIGQIGSAMPCYEHLTDPAKARVLQELA